MVFEGCDTIKPAAATGNSLTTWSHDQGKVKLNPEINCECNNNK